MDQYIGRMLDGRYEILERIGTGGMAVVYKTRDQRLNRLVAVKVLRPDLAQDADFRRRFNAESQAVAQLSHPNIVSVYDVSRGGDTEYIVMELIDGITLKQYMEKRGQLNWRESLHFITQIMRGLSHAHSRGIVHRDIKPQNIMVLRDGSVKVADFGIACLENSAQTLTQEALGSVHYISPEQARGDRTDARSDIYSAGVVMYEMLTNRLPFEGDSAVSVAIQHLSSVPLAPREVNPEIPPQLELICMKAMTPDLERRYASADAMIADLENFRKNPSLDLDFSMVDLRPEEPDDPTRPIRNYDQTLQRSRERSERERERERKRRRDGYDDYDEPMTGVRIGQKVLFGVALVLAVTLAVVLFRTISASFQPDESPSSQYVVVPNVVGYTIEQASVQENVQGVFTLEKKGEEFSEEPAGVIIRQSPVSENYTSGENLVIEVWVSAGEDTGVMLDVVNKTVAEAKMYLKDLKDRYNLEIEEDTDHQFNDSITEGHIISTEPAAGETLKKGDVVRLIVSKGPELIEFPVPSFVGQNIDDVRPKLTSTWKLTCTDADIDYVESDQKPGTILWQSIKDSSMAQEWDTIKFQVSKGPSSYTIDYGIDLPQDDRSTVWVEVYVGDETEPQYAEQVSCGDVHINVKLTGSGTQSIRVLFDSELDQWQSGEKDFSQ